MVREQMLQACSNLHANHHTHPNFFAEAVHICQLAPFRVQIIQSSAGFCD
jgi:hypothetical protein